MLTPEASMPSDPAPAGSDKVREALRTLAQFCVDQGYDTFRWTLRKGPHDPDGGVTDWRIIIRPASTPPATD